MGRADVQEVALMVFERFPPKVFTRAPIQERDDIRQHVVLLTMQAVLRTEVKDPIAYAKTIAWQERFGINFRRRRPVVELDSDPSINLGRSNNVQKERPLSDLLTSSDKNQLEELLEQERHNLIPHIWEASSGLSPQCKKAISRFLTGMPKEQICRDMKMTERQFAKLKCLALARMREVTQERGL